jgi:serine/threonine-protein kinase RsbW
MLVEALEWPRLPRQLASCRQRDSVYYRGRRCVRKSASGDLSEMKREIWLLRRKESAHVSRGSLLLRMELQSNPEMLCVVRNALAQLAAMLGFSEPECRAVVLAVDEALTNIIRHAYLGDAERPIEASFRRIHVPHDGQGRDALEIVLEDRGVSVNPKNMCGRALEDVRPGGLGLHFIRESMDTVEFSRSWGRNQLRLVKILHVQGSRKGS